jgi:hypothetical protein
VKRSVKDGAKEKGDGSGTSNDKMCCVVVARKLTDENLSGTVN